MEQFLEFITNHWMLSSAFTLVALMLLVLELKSGIRGNAVTPQNLVMMVNHEGAVMLDTRSLESYNTGHILNSIHFPADQVDSKLNTLTKYKSKTLVVLCQSGMKSGPVVTSLAKAGYNAKQLAGGIDAWKEASLPLVKKG